VSEVDRKARAKALDMSTVSRDFEREVVHPVKNLVTGKLVRVMLVNVQYLKTQALDILEVLNDIYSANQVCSAAIAHYLVLCSCSGSNSCSDSLAAA
jgi:ATP synthase regulation protein NCA2